MKDKLGCDLANTDDAKEVVITYETLYELQRREKNREELQVLEPAFFLDTLRYLKDKQAYYDSCMARNDLFSISERDKTLQQLQNAKRILKELYERREKKIIDLAVNKSRTNSSLINTSNLLMHEKATYEALVNVLNEFRDTVLVRIMALHAPAHQPVSQIPPSANTTEPTATDHVKSSIVTKLVRFLGSVDKFLGEELEEYGPYNENDKAYLPANLVEILVQNGKATEITE